MATPSATLNPPPPDHRRAGYVGNEGCKQTYSASIKGLVPAASATDIFTLLGSATKQIKLNKVVVSGTAGTAIAANFQLVRRSTANTGGTKTDPVIAKHDTNNSDATAVASAYTANPTLGTGAGVILAARVGIPLASAVAQPTVFTFGDRNGQPIVLNGVTEQIALNLNAQTISSGLLDITFEWTEE